MFADAGYIGVEKRPEAAPGIDWRVAMKAGKRRALGRSLDDRIREKIEQLKASVRSRGEHAFRVLKRQFGYVKVRYRGLAKNGNRVFVTAALANIFLVRYTLLGAVRPQ